DEARDRAHDFFEWLLDDDCPLLLQAREQRGNFRGYLLKAARNRGIDALRQEQRRARRVVSIDADVEDHYLALPAAGLTPERCFDRRWALTVLGRTLRSLQGWYEARGKGALFERLVGCLAGEDERRYREIAAELGISEPAFAQEVKRCKDRYQARLHA